MCPKREIHEGTTSRAQNTEIPVPQAPESQELNTGALLASEKVGSKLDPCSIQAQSKKRWSRVKLGTSKELCLFFLP